MVTSFSFLYQILAFQALPVTVIFPKKIVFFFQALTVMLKLKTLEAVFFLAFIAGY